jgi:hypothetical protein
LGITWNASGDPNGKVQLFRNQQPVYEGGPGPTTFFDAFVPGTLIYIVRATNSSGKVTDSLPLTVSPTCIKEFKLIYFDACNDGCYVVRFLWTVEGNKSGTVKIVHTPTGAVFNASLAPGSFTLPNEMSCPDDYQTTFTVPGGMFITPVMRPPGNFNDCGSSSD